jgi:hypothetical protein
LTDRGTQSGGRLDLDQPKRTALCMTTRPTNAAAAPIEFSVAVMMMVMMMMAATDANAYAGDADDRPMVMMVVMVVVAVMVMVVMAIARDLHLPGLSRDVLLACRTGRGVRRPQSRHGIRDRVEQLGVGFRAGRLRRRRSGCGLCGRVECRQPGDGADGADDFLIHEDFFPLVRSDLAAHTSPAAGGPALQREPADKNMVPLRW